MPEEDKDKGAEIGRALGKAFKNARPKAQQFAEHAKPKVEKAFQSAVEFAKDHESEAKTIAQQVVKARVTGPVGLVVDAFASQLNADKPAGAASAGQCASCGNPNPTTAKFCNNCGTSLTAAAPAASPTQPTTQ